MQPTELLAQADCPPTHFYVPEGARFTLADEVADLMESVGYQVGPEERLTCYALYPQKANGDWAGLESGVEGPRQNLKTTCMIGGALHDTFVQGIDAGWTAHEFKTSTAAFRDFQAVIEGNTWLSSEVLKIRTGSVDPGFELRNGARLDIIARTGKSGRGMARPRLYLDEGLYLVAAMMGALVPTMSAMPNAHMTIGSSPPLMMSDVLREYEQRVESGVDPHLGWIAWLQKRQPCSDPQCRHKPGTPGCWLDDLEAVKRVNPAHPRRISLDFLVQERLALAAAPDEYLRERMGVGEEPPPEGSLDPPYPPDALAGLVDDSPPPKSASVAWSVDVSWDRSTAYISKAARASDGTPLPKVTIICDPSHVVALLPVEAAKVTSVGVAVQGGGAPASSLVDPLRKALEGICDVVEVTGTDAARACGMTYDAIRDKAIRRPSDTLIDEANRAAVKRTVGDGWAIDRKKSPPNAAALVSWTYALWLLLTQPEPGEPGVWFL